MRAPEDDGCHDQRPRGPPPERGPDGDVDEHQRPDLDRCRRDLVADVHERHHDELHLQPGRPWRARRWLRQHQQPTVLDHQELVGRELGRERLHPRPEGHEPVPDHVQPVLLEGHRRLEPDPKPQPRQPDPRPVQPDAGAFVDGHVHAVRVHRLDLPQRLPGSLVLAGRVPGDEQRWLRHRDVRHHGPDDCLVQRHGLHWSLDVVDAADRPVPRRHRGHVCVQHVQRQQQWKRQQRKRGKLQHGELQLQRLGRRREDAPAPARVSMHVISATILSSPLTFIFTAYYLCFLCSGSPRLPCAC
mmetsp:Transcript_68174/g.79324  ORF Transcript_68174/g.79324 Transcript_68174/m.79324 type:complete len:301 (+) Transcript_68174:675-1577(+)